jgi:Leucine-rich repeat (LRR) protein
LDFANISAPAELSALQELYVSGTKVANLAPLASLSTLQRLDISNTQVTDLSPLVLNRDILSTRISSSSNE